MSLPLAILFQRSVSEGEFPSKWKEALITPVHKNGTKERVENYRPVSILPVFSKVFESLVFDQLYPVALAYIPDAQHGFMRNRSTVSNLSVFTDFVARNMDKGYQVDVVYTDYAKCFDRINHDVLLSKLLGIGVHGDLLRWLESYLRNRRQAVRIGAYKSNFSVIPSGVPQGSHLGPLLFNIYLHDIISCFQNSDVLMYADDKKIYRAIKDEADCTELQRDLDRLTKYCVYNCLNLNDKKCQVMTFTRNKNTIGYEYLLNNTVIPRVSVVKDLGVLLDSKLLFTEHYEYIIQRAEKLLGFIYRSTKPFKGAAPLRVLFCAYIRSIMEYASPIWTPTYITHRQRLESIQSKFVRLLNCRKKVNHVHDYKLTLKKDNLLTLEDRRTLADMKLLYNIINSFMDCPQLNRRVGLLAANTRTRHTRLFHTEFAHTNYAKYSLINRLTHIYNTRFANIDIFLLKRNQFLRGIIDQLNCHSE